MDLALIGLGVMGKNLVLNFIDKGYKVSVYNRTVQKAKEFEKEVNNQKVLKHFDTIEDLINSLKSPRVVIVLIQAGSPVDQTCLELSKYLKRDDVVMDLGNSNYSDTMRRCNEFKEKFSFVGCGISGGEEGARYGPSLMPGGNFAGWKHVEKIMKDISAKYLKDNVEYPCCEWIGDSGSGHFVKMIHNGMEYGDMGIIAESYSIMKAMRMTNIQIQQFFNECNDIKELKGYLIEIASTVVSKKDNSGEYILEKILDKAGNKGTGIWSVKAAMDCSYYATLMTSAVFSRMISSEKNKRVQFSKSKQKGLPDLKISVTDLKKSMILAKAISYVQGLNLIKKMSDIHDWKIDLMQVCNVWKNGCIIRGGFLEIAQMIVRDDDYENTEKFLEIYENNITGLRNVVVETSRCGIPSICFGSCLSFLDSLGCEVGNGNMIQALRDFFGAHMVRFIGSEEDIHIEWV